VFLLYLLSLSTGSISALPLTMNKGLGGSNFLVGWLIDAPTRAIRDPLLAEERSIDAGDPDKMNRGAIAQRDYGVSAA
jgi:hypothetical protein